MDDEDVKIVFKKDTCKMVQGALVFMGGILELYTSFWVVLLVMGATILWFLKVE